MTKDYKSRATPKEGGRVHRPCLFWFAAGALAGAFAVGLLWLKLDPALGRSGAPLAGTGVPRPKPDEAPQPASTEGLEFEFPELLRKMQVMLPDDDGAKPAAAPSHPAVPAPKVHKPAAPPQPAAAVVARPPSRATASAAPATPATPAAAPVKEAYVLQLGAFRRSADAERRKAQLALMGVESYVQRVTTGGKDTYYRVRSGPYRSQARMDEVRRLLTRNKINSVVVRWSSG